MGNRGRQFSNPLYSCQITSLCWAKLQAQYYPLKTKNHDISKPQAESIRCSSVASCLGDWDDL